MLHSMPDCAQFNVTVLQKIKILPVALLDAMSEEININLFRRGPALAGLSAAPIGSGMAFETAIIREILSSARDSGESRERTVK